MDNQKQLEEIKIDTLINIIKEKELELFNNILIDKSQTVDRANYLFYDYNAKSIDRVATVLKTPLWDNIKDGFSELIGGEEVHGRAAFVPNESLLPKLMQNDYVAIESIKTAEYLNALPVEEEDDVIKDIQKSYFIPSETSVDNCHECSGGKYIDCQEADCSVRHEWTCTECLGKKQVICPTCTGEGKNRCSECGGDGSVKCGSLIGSSVMGSLGSTSAGCNGTGHIYVTKPGSKTGQKVQKKCNKCRGKGSVSCNECIKGLVACNGCDGVKKLNCPTCDARGTEICTMCYGQGLTKKDFKYAKVDCPTCRATGQMASISFVQSSLHNDDAKNLMSVDQIIENLKDDDIKSCVPDNYACNNVLNNLNAKYEENYDSAIKEIAQGIKIDFGLSIKDFKKVIHENMYSKIIPCVALEYVHILTQTRHHLAVVNVFEDPKIIFFSKPNETEKTNFFINIGNTVNVFFGKLFKLKGYKEKEDKKLEIKLMIRLMRADNKIEEKEKTFLVEKITDLKGFTNNEKSELYQLLNSNNLMELVEDDVAFYSQERARKVLFDLKKMSESDGEEHNSEVILIEKIDRFINK